MKKSELTNFVKEEIISALTYDEYKDLFKKRGIKVKEDAETQQDIKDTEELTKAIDDLTKAKKEAGIEEKVAKTVDDVIDPADYGLIGQGYLKGFNKPHSLNADDLETLGRKIVDSLYKGDFDKAKAKFIKEDLREDEDKEPSKADLKKTKGLAKAKEELAQLTKQMKSLARKYKKAEGAEKEKLVADLKKKTKLKKELEAIIDK